MREFDESIFDELHRLAKAAMLNETAAHSLQPTLLVNDAYLKLAAQRNLDAADRSQLLAAGANIIRRLLVEYARKRRALKRGGPDGRGEPLHVNVAADSRELDMLELDDALEKLQTINARAAEVVELKFFGGLQVEEIAQQLEVSERTVKSDWRFAKAWLHRELGMR